jgi:hypothetical protein
MTSDEIRAAITAQPEIRALLPAAELIAQAEIDAVAAALSVGRTRHRSTHVGPGTIMAVLGAAEGAALLETLTTMAAAAGSVPAYVPIKWAMKIIDRGELDLGVQATRDQIAALAAGGVMSAASRDKLLALGAEPDPISEYSVRCAIFADDGSLLV